MRKLDKVFRVLLYVLPGVLYFSYYPIISLGRNESMNFELSLPLVWLVVFDLVGLVVMVRRQMLFDSWGKWWWVWLLFPLWVSLSLIWSLNLVRGVLTVGIMWLVFFAGYVMWSVRRLFDGIFWVKWWKWFFGSTVLVCVWCMVQCVLDMMGVTQGYSLMCDGCTYHMFGFPHPNGFAIEPQFMGNLLLAPAIASIYYFVEKKYVDATHGRVVVEKHHERRFSRSVIKNLLWGLLPIVILVTLFLTFSRGAIYALVVGLLFMSGFMICRVRKQKRTKYIKRVLMAWGIVFFSFVITLNIQGLMAELGPTGDTYYDGVGKVLNHLSLGLVNIKEVKTVENYEGDGKKTGEEWRKDDNELVENSEDKDVEQPVENYKEKAVFDGYVVESTDTRVKLTGVALKRWSNDISSMVLGVGIGGAGVALYDNGLSSSPKEIVQNEYASLLLEIGLIGVSLLVMMMVLVVRLVLKNSMKGLIMSLMVAYGVSLMFFSGFANALQIYLLPMMLIALGDGYKVKRKKLVS